MANRYANLVGSNKIKDEYTKINQGFDAVEADMDAKSNKSVAQVNDIEFEADDSLTVEAGTGITVTTTPAEKKLRITATGEATPGLHGAEHNHDGADPIPELVQVREDLAELKAETTPMLDTTELVSTLSSFFGFVNKAYLADNGTRIYILPRDAVTTGVGGVLKIFGDAYHLDDTTYRDLGVYFHQNQLGDTGYNGQGCFFINVKVAGAAYANKHPDIVFSFQDGAQTAGRFVRLANEKGTYTCLIIGAGNVEIADIDGAIRAELHGSMGIRNNHGLKWLDASGNLTGILMYDNNNRMVQKAVAGFEQHINSVKVVESNGNSTKYNHAVVHTPKTVITDNFDTTPNVAATNRIQFNQSSATTITNFVNGTDGQQLRILFSNGNTKLQHGTNIRLAGGVDYTGAQYDTLTLELWGTTWYEMSRSQNHT